MPEIDSQQPKKRGRPRKRCDSGKVHSIDKVFREFDQAERRCRVSELYLKGMSQQAIADVVGVSYTTISADIRHVQAEWLAMAMVNMDEIKAKELAKLDRMERVAWEGWERSVQDHRVKSHRVEHERSDTLLFGHSSEKRKKKEGRPKKVKETNPGDPSYPDMVPKKILDELKTTSQAGDPRFLERVAWCIEMRTKILGLVLEQKVTNQLFVNWDDMVDIIDQSRSQPTPTPLPPPSLPVTIENITTNEPCSNQHNQDSDTTAKSSRSERPTPPTSNGDSRT